MKPLLYKRFEKMLEKLPKPSYKFLEEWYKDIQKPVRVREDLVLREDGTIDIEKTKEKKSLKKGMKYMKDLFKDLLYDNAGKVETEKGALAHSTTGDKVLNMFALGASYRGRTDNEVRDLVDDAWNDDKDLALRALFYIGDIRGGQGERRFLKVALKYLAKKDPETIKKILPLVPVYSRWDIMLEFIGTPLESDALEVMAKQFVEDWENAKEGKPISLLAKWLPSPGTKSQKQLAILIAKAFMNSFMNYQKAFEKHTPEKMEEFRKKVEKGEAVVKSATLYPYEILYKMRKTFDNNELTLLQNAWDNLPNYVGEDKRGIAVIDTSGSMTSNIGNTEVEILDVATALGIYLSERLTGPYKDHYITFSETPIFGKLKGHTVAQKAKNMRMINQNTHIKKVFDLILEIAVRNKVKQADMPTHLYIFSDMEFDQAQGYNSYWSRGVETFNKTLFEIIKEEYRKEGYETPKLIFWNLDARNDQYPVREDESGAALVSGFSPSILKNVMMSNLSSPKELMIEVLDSPRYKVLSECVVK